MKVLRSIDPRIARETEGNWDEKNREWIVYLSSGKVGNQELAELVPYLQPPERLRLVLENNAVTDEGITHLAPLKNLVNLIFGRAFGDVTAAFLVNFPALEELWFLKSKVTDAAMPTIGSLKRLERLGLECRSITDAGMPHLANLKRLRDLDLKGAKISDAGLTHLHGLRGLRELTISGKLITAEGQERLQKAIPKLRIFLYP